MGDCERERNGAVIWLIENGTIPVQNGTGRACTAGGPLQSKLKCNGPNAANGYFAAFCPLQSKLKCNGPNAANSYFAAFCPLQSILKCNGHALQSCGI